MVKLGGDAVEATVRLGRVDPLCGQGHSLTEQYARLTSILTKRTSGSLWLTGDDTEA